MEVLVMEGRFQRTGIAHCLANILIIEGAAPDPLRYPLRRPKTTLWGAREEAFLGRNMGCTMGGAP